MASVAPNPICSLGLFCAVAIPTDMAIVHAMAMNFFMLLLSKT
jgi:hypothetical protein